MWIWWILSLIILIVCIIFAYRMIVSSYEFLPADKRYFLSFFRNAIPAEKSALQKDSFKVLKHKVQSVEDSNTFCQIQLSKFQQRLKILEDINLAKEPAEITVNQKELTENAEDWKEMYYEENGVKEKLENELDITKQMLEETQNKLNNALENNSRNIQLQSDYETRLYEIHSLQNEIKNLQQQLIASSEREKELEQLLITEITIREKYSMLQKEYVQLQSEADDLRRRILEINKKDLNLEMRLAHLGELENKLAACVQEKLKLKSNLENRLLG